MEFVNKLTIEQINKMPRPELHQELFKCCSSMAWVENLAKKRPFLGMTHLIEEAQKLWDSLGERDWLEAFSGHPQIGDLATLEQKYGNTADWASGEQSGVGAASREVLLELADYNKKYLKKFGFIFIVCATGKSANEMLDLLKSRIDNTRSDEILIAGAEQFKITKIRLEKLL